VDWNSDHLETLAVHESEMFSKGFYEPFLPLAAASTLTAQGVGTWYLDPFMVPAKIGSGQLNYLAADVAGFLNGAVYSAASSGSITRYQTLSTKVAIYNNGTGANSTRLETIWTGEVSVLATWERRIGTTTTSNGTVSNYLSLSFPSQYDASGGVTYGSTSQSGTTALGASTGASTIANNLITGAVAYLSGSKFIPIPFATQLNAGEYYIGVMISSTSSSTGTNYSTGTMFSTQSVFGQVEHINQAYKMVGRSVSNTSTCIMPFHGSVASTSTSPITSLGTSDMRNFAANQRRYWNYVQSSY
jgi:hypothetical protein